MLKEKLSENFGESKTFGLSIQKGGEGWTKEKGVGEQLKAGYLQHTAREYIFSFAVYDLIILLFYVWECFDCMYISVHHIHAWGL